MTLASKLARKVLSSDPVKKDMDALLSIDKDKKEARDLIEDPNKRKQWVQNKRNELGIEEQDSSYSKDALVPKEEVKRRQTRKFADQIKQLEQNEITGKEYRTFIKENQPATKFSEEDLENMLPSFTDTVAGLDARNQNNAKKGIIGLTESIKKGERVKTRLDIPSYNLRDIWVAQITGNNKTMYGRTAVLKNGSFSIEGKDPARKIQRMLDVGKGEKDKQPFATMDGEWQNVSDEEAFQLAKKYINDPEWTQVGFNPERHSFFYDKDTMMPIFNFEELVQVGPLVLAKVKKTNVLSKAERIERIGKLRELRIPDKVGKPAIYNEGGAVQMQKQMEMFNDGGLKEEGGSKDPVSGNDVPSGSLKEEVRDDIDAKLSPGEFVFPADVVRFIGLEKLMLMRDKAKKGLARMEAMGQMGNSDEATIDDDVPFGMEDLIIVAGPPDNEMNKGGMPTYANGGAGRFQQIVGQPMFESTTKVFRNDQGQELYIPFVRGQPVYQPPLGYREVSVEDTQPTTTASNVTSARVDPVTETGSGELGGGPDASDMSVGEMSPTQQADLGQFNIDNPTIAGISETIGNVAEGAVTRGFGAPGVGMAATIGNAVAAMDDDASLAEMAKSAAMAAVNPFGGVKGQKGLGTRDRELAEKMREMRANNPQAFAKAQKDFATELATNVDKSLAGYSNATVEAAKDVSFGASPAQMSAHAEGVSRGDRPQGSTANAVGGYTTVGPNTPFGYSTNKFGEVDYDQTQKDREKAKETARENERQKELRGMGSFGGIAAPSDPDIGAAGDPAGNPGGGGKEGAEAQGGVAGGPQGGPQSEAEASGQSETVGAGTFKGGFITKNKKQKKNKKRGGLASR